MNRLPIFNLTPKDADSPIEAGVKLYRPDLTEVYSDRDGFLIIIWSAETTDIAHNGTRMLKFERTDSLKPDDGQWYLERWMAELRGAELLVKRKEKMLDHITKQMDRAEASRKEVAAS